MSWKRKQHRVFEYSWKFGGETWSIVPWSMFPFMINRIIEHPTPYFRHRLPADGYFYRINILTRDRAEDAREWSELKLLRSVLRWRNRLIFQRLVTQRDRADLLPDGRRVFLSLPLLRIRQETSSLTHHASRVTHFRIRCCKLEIEKNADFSELQSREIEFKRISS